MVMKLEKDQLLGNFKIRREVILNYGNILQQAINTLFVVIQSNNLERLSITVNDMGARFGLDKIVLAEFVFKNNGASPLDFYSPPPSYNDYVFLANKYISLLQGELYDFQSGSSPLTTEARDLLYNGTNLTSRDTIHIKNGKKITVSELLAVIKFAKKVLNKSGFKMSKELSSGIDVALLSLDAFDFALNGVHREKPLNKALHLINEALSITLEITIEDEKIGEVVEVASSTIDLAIDFLIEK